MKEQLYILTILLLSSCRFSDKELKVEIVPYYVVTSYYNNPDDPKNFFSAKYYDSSNRLIREIGRDGDCTRYIYDKNNRLIETIWGRTCEHGLRQIFIFDSLENKIGYYMTQETLVDLDTVKFEQIFFYDSENRLIKERNDVRQDFDGNTFETWHYYSYNGNVKTSVEIMENNITIWHGKYLYNSNGKLIELKMTRNQVFNTEYYIYDDLGRMIEKGTKSNDIIITPMGTFNYPHRKRIFNYDSTGFASKEILYQDDKVELVVFNVKTYKN